jgi:RNA polymerase sigma-54 factor
MALSLQLNLKQTQKLIMTQTLRQSIEMLQLSTVEIADKIAEELVANPALDETTRESLQDSPLVSSLTENINHDLERDMGSEAIQNSYGDDISSYRSSAEYDRQRQYIENVISSEESLTEHLLWQARMTAEDERQYIVFEAIITSLDERGFLVISPEDIAGDLNCDTTCIESSLNTVQLFDPVGCAVSSVQESLLIQARHYYPHDELLHVLITQHFDALEKLDYQGIARKLTVSIEEIYRCGSVLQGMDPYPGSTFTRNKTQFIVPDVEVRLIDGDVQISLNDEWLPGISLSSYFTELLKNKKMERQQRQYIQEKLQAAKYFIRNIETRRESIYRVVRAIMERQRDFLESGPGNLKGLTHSDIAEETGLHESTVSRVTTNKYVQTKWGVFDLKYFFVSKIKGAHNNGSGDTSSDRVKYLLVRLIEHEDHNKPYSDDEIVTLLGKDGVEVARRTVAKYRGALEIPTSGIRRKLYAIKEEEKKSI